MDYCKCYNIHEDIAKVWWLVAGLSPGLGGCAVGEVGGAVVGVGVLCFEWVWERVRVMWCAWECGRLGVLCFG